MAKKKKLPEIIITGTPQELVEIEPLLVMAGYDEHVSEWTKPHNQIICYGDGVIVYANGCVPARNREEFKSSEIHKILHYIETGEIKEYREDKIGNPADWKWVNEPLGSTHTGQAGVVGNKPVKLFESSFKETKKGLIIKPIKMSLERKMKSNLRKMKLKKWKLIEKEFKQWANPNTKNGIAYYSPTSQLELLAFFKKQFIK